MMIQPMLKLFKHFWLIAYKAAKVCLQTGAGTHRFPGTDGCVPTQISVRLWRCFLSWHGFKMVVLEIKDEKQLRDLSAKLSGEVRCCIIKLLSRTPCPEALKIITHPGFMSLSARMHLLISQGSW
eukprot:1158990-Pelagomonas_calceolata.AAC.2